MAILIQSPFQRERMFEYVRSVWNRLDGGLRLRIDPFQVVIQAVGFTEPTGTVAMVDDIEIQCDPCGMA